MMTGKKAVPYSSVLPGLFFQCDRKVQRVPLPSCEGFINFQWALKAWKETKHQTQLLLYSTSTAQN